MKGKIKTKLRLSPLGEIILTALIGITGLVVVNLAIYALFTYVIVNVYKMVMGS